VALAFALLLVGALRGGRAAMLGAVPAVTVVALLVQAACALAAGIGLWMRRSWTLPALAGLGAGVVLQTAAESLFYEISPLLPALAVALGAIALLLAVGVLAASELEPAPARRGPRRGG
jgi:hypothetical protein